MYIYDEIFEESFYTAQNFDFYYRDAKYFGDENLKVGIFDIETTGLSPQSCQVIMGALLTRVDGGVRVRQYFTEDDGEEAELLAIYKEALDEVDVLVSYNGDGFDFPFLKKRLARHMLDDSFAKAFSLDLYSILHKYSNLRDIIPNLKQVTVEEYMGLRDSREDTIDGGKSVELFFQYLSNKSQELKEMMLLHNRDDVLQLQRLLWIFDKLNIHRVAYHMGFPVICDDKKMLITKIKVKTKRLDIKGRYAGMTGRYHIFREDSTIVLNPSKEQSLLDPESDYGEFEISVPLRYEDKIAYVLASDMEFEVDVFPNQGANGQKLAVLKRDGEVVYESVNCFAKELIRDILKSL